jgi:hypothetical protein
MSDEFDFLEMECGVCNTKEPQVHSLEQAKEELSDVLDQLISLNADFSNGFMDEWPLGSEH